jgi:DNA-directed RNA polymerase subunit beta
MPANPLNLQRIFSSPAEITKRVDEALVNGLAKQFPIESRNYRVEISNVRPEHTEVTNADEKEAILRSKSLTYPIKADVKLIDKNTGLVVDESKGYNLMDSFHLTGKHTLVYKGSNYSVSNQLQLRPGVYTRSKETGELESHFNTGTGRSFSITLEPQSGLFYVNIGSSSIPIAPLLTTVFGIGPKEVGAYIPPQVWEDNLKATAGKEAKIVGDFYKRLVSTAKQKPGASLEEMASQLKISLESSSLSEHTTKATLGKALTSVNHEAILLALRNLADVHAGRRPEDNRDSLQFKRVQNFPDFISTRFEKDHQIVRSAKNKIVRDMERMDKNAPTVRGALSTKPLNKFLSNYIVSSQLASTPSETNPIESLENVAKVTILGANEGGISSERAVPMSSRDIDASHLGIIDPSRTPESSHAGIDQRFTVSARRDKEGNLYCRVLDNQGKVQYLSVTDMMSHTIGFPHQDPKLKKVQAQVKGELKESDRSKVDYWLADGTDMYTVTTNLVPFLNSNHPGRLTMAGKAIPQALSLVDREAPLVQTTNANGSSMVQGLAKVTSTISNVMGTVKEATSKHVVIQDENGKNHKVFAIKNMPFNMKGFLDDEKLLVKAGDKVDPSTVLYENNYTKDGALALGKNLNVAYIPYKGYNHEDGLVISKSAAAGLSSHHAYKVDYSVQATTLMKKALITRYFPGRFTKEQIDKLDDKGFAKVGAILNHGDPAYIVLERREPTPEDKVLGRLHKTLVNPYRAVTEVWTHDENGLVVDSHTDGKELRLIVRSQKPLEVGDKLTGLHGNKGIVSLILDDHDMPFIKETGKPVDLLLNPASVTSRVNLGQLMETAAAKIAIKTGKPYLVHNFTKTSNVGELSAELKKHGIPDAEMMVDPKTGKDLGKILTGPQYMLKLYKTSDQNWSARNVGGYDNTMQPTKGGEEGSKSVGWMEALGLMGSNARHNLKEITTLKSEENQEYWDKFLTGQALPKPKTTFATKKFFDYLTGSGIKTSIKDGKITASPLTDKDILGMSHGVIIEPTMLAAKDLAPEKGGLFDQTKTGGVRGNRWTHYQLAESIPHPLMERPIKSILGMSTKEFDAIAHGSVGVKHEGNGIFHLHDVVTGKHIKTINVNTAKPLEEIEPVEAEEDDI